MDKLWDGNPAKSEVIGCCGRDEKTELPQSRQNQTHFLYIAGYKSILFLCYQHVYITGKTGSWGHRESKQQQQRSFMWGITGEQEWSPELTTGMCVHTLFLQVEW